MKELNEKPIGRWVKTKITLIIIHVFILAFAFTVNSIAQDPYAGTTGGVGSPLLLKPSDFDSWDTYGSSPKTSSKRSKEARKPLILKESDFDKTPFSYNEEGPYKATADTSSLKFDESDFDETPFSYNEKISKTEQGSEPTEDDTGFFTEVGKDLGRGFSELANLSGSALQVIDPDGGIDILDTIGQKMIDGSDGIK